MMSGAKKIVPKRRFKEFLNAGDWEQRKLGDIATFSKGNGYSKSDLGSSGDPIILYGRLYTNYETTISNVDTFVELKDKSIISQGGEVIVPASGETAEDISRASVVKNQGIIIGGDLNVIKANYLLDPTFLALTISNGEQQKELSKRAQGKSVVHLHNSDLQEVNLTFPLLNEQKEISTLFEKMDNIITLHQRKLDKLQATKKALLQEMFPEEGQDKPKRRFKGFTDAWEQRKLGDIATFSKGNGYSKSDLGSSGDPIILYGRLYTNYETTISNVDTFVELKDKSIISQGGEVIVPASGETAEDISRASVVKNQGIIIGGDLNVIKANYLLDPTFLALTISNGEQQKELSKRAQGKSVVHLHNSDLQEVNLTFPLLNEQKEISTLFEKMDNIITLHQRKLDKLKNLKQAYLNEMFV